MKSITSPYIEVRRSGIHNRGVFAKENISKGIRVVEYVGEKITKEESDKRIDKSLEDAEKNSKNGETYIFELDDKYDIDGNVPYNSARLINHSCEPNCETDIIDGKIWIIALRNIKKGEEITYDYAFDLDGFEDYPCKCGSKNCVGYIVSDDHWDELSKAVKEK